MTNRILQLVPGLAVLLVGAGVAYGLSQTVLGINELILAIVIGFVVTNTVGLPDWAEKGVSTHKLWLETGIVLMGARIALDQLIATGPRVLLVIVAFLVFTVGYVEFLSRNIFGITDQMGSLLAAGSSICGVSAIVAVAGSVRAKSEQTAYAVATILVFDALTLTTYPIVGRLLDLPDIVFGTWAGISMFSTGPVVAAGVTYSKEAAEWATITKLGRNIFIGVLAITYAVYYARQHGQEDGNSIGNKWLYIWEQFPKFVLGFLLVIIIVSLGLLPEQDVTLMRDLYQWLFLVAFVGLGANIQLQKMRNTGIKPALTVLTAFLTVSIVSLLTSLFLFG
jgi:uncharacterized integral membrane protein (TIGR00698 family)